MAQERFQLIAGFATDTLVVSVLLALASCQAVSPGANLKVVSRDLSRSQPVGVITGARVVERDLVNRTPSLSTMPLASPETSIAQNDLTPRAAASIVQPAIVSSKPAEQAANAAPQEILPDAAASSLPAVASAPLVKSVDTVREIIKVAATSYTVPFASGAETLGPKGNVSLDQAAKELANAGAITLRGRSTPNEEGDLQVAQDLALRRAWLVGLNLERRGVKPQSWRYFFSGKKNKDSVEVEPQ